ncbi:hypothetical protein PENSPDRAFT_649710 [Peniophora sp. CONT]|nr:hypothetical protein PENSPDRAFT_649710 [Peniophora sp. CONT]
MSDSPRDASSSRSSDSEERAGFSTPIRRFTAEVLVQIFGWSVIVDPVHLAGSRNLDKPLPRHLYGWLNVTHVCRRWRRLALDSPALWTNIHTTMGESWVDAFLTRSKNLTVSFSNFYNPSVVEDPYRLMANPILAEHIQRMHAITLLQPKYGKLHTDLLQTLPALESLTLFSQFLMLANTSFAEEFHAPRLRHISVLSPQNFPLHAPFVRNLSSLCLANRSTPGFIEPGAFYEPLRHMNRLERLCLEDLLPGTNGATEMEPVALPHLTLLRLHGKCDQVIGMLSKLRIGRVELDIACTHVDLAAGTTEGLMSTLSSFLQDYNAAFAGVPAHTFKALSLIQCAEIEKPWVSIHAERHDVDHNWDPVWRAPYRVRLNGQYLPQWQLDRRFQDYADTPLTGSFNLTLVFKKAGPDVIREVLDRALGQLPLLDVRLLRLEGQHASTFLTPFSHVPRVRHVRAYPPAVAHCIAKLTQKTEGNVRLATELAELSLPQLPPIAWADDSTTSADPLCSQICDLLEDRITEGMEPIRTIYVQHPALHFRSLFRASDGAWFGLPETLRRLVKEEPSQDDVA